MEQDDFSWETEANIVVGNKVEAGVVVEAGTGVGVGVEQDLQETEPCALVVGATVLV